MDNETQRYQMVASGNHVLDLNRALIIADLNGDKKVRICHPDMGNWWGTNQPSCLAFTANAKQAKDMCEGYGASLNKVETRRIRK